ncbi:MAG: FitA-like ribbon-helix-helix domain-containing protein [Micropepsaceae bacterium]
MSNTTTTPTLTIRGLPAKDYDRLRKRAAESKRSMEAEARAIMSEALAPRPRKKVDKEWLKKLQDLVAQTTKKRGPGNLLSEEFMRDRRKMWGEE